MTGECWLNPRNISVCSASNTNLTQAATAEVQLTVRGEGLGPDSAATAATAAVVPVRVRGVLSFSFNHLMTVFMFGHLRPGLRQIRRHSRLLVSAASRVLQL